MPVLSNESSIDPITLEALISFKKLLEARYGEHLKSLYLFGSRARGDHRPDSDADVAVFLGEMGTQPFSSSAERDRNVYRHAVAAHFSSCRR